LVQSLHYRGPARLHDAVRRACSRRLREAVFGQALDLGCGTGLTGEVFRPDCAYLGAVDLSPAMAKRAAAKRIYDELAIGDAVAWLCERPDGSADLALAADVFIYIPDLAPVFAQVSRVLRPDGLFAFTVQTHGGEGVILGEDARYAHAERYLREVAEQAGLGVALLEEASIRQDRGEDVPGLIAVLAR
jgi:predicted TPR repeat methyltransferase